MFLPGKSHGLRSLIATVHGIAKSGHDWATSLPFNSHWELCDKPLSLGGNWSKFINRTLHYFPIHNKITPSVFQKTHYKVVSTIFAFLLSLCEFHPPSKLYLMGFPGGSDSKKNLPAMQRPGFDPWIGKAPWRRAWQPTSVFLPGESPWTEEPGRLQSMGRKELDMTERLSTAHSKV